MRQTTTLLVLFGLAALAGAQEPAAAPNKVTITIAFEGSKCVAKSADPNLVEVNLGEDIEWTVSAPGDCADKNVKLKNFKLKPNDTPKDPLDPGCRKDVTGSGKIRCKVSGGAKGDLYKYDVHVAGGTDLDPEIRIRS
jgi:hypothetical protein